MSKKPIFLAAITAAALTVGATKQVEAVSIDYRTLEADQPLFGAVASSNDIDNPANWDYFQFSGEEGDRATVRVRRIDRGLDPAFGIWEGLARDTSEFSSIFSSGSTLRQITSADDEINTPGPFGDPLSTFRLPSTGDYTLGVTSFLSTDSSEPLAYQVPEPLTVLGSLAAIGMGAFLKREYSRKTKLVK